MNGNVLSDVKKTIEGHKGLAAYAKANGPTAARRFWNLLRSDLMRHPPGEVAEYLRDSNSKLADAGSFGEDHAKKFDESEDNEPRTHQEALIYACLEMDAAWRLSLQTDQSLKKSLRKKLKIWRTPS